MSDEKLQELVKEYADLAKDKNIDAAGLMINALQQQDQNKLNQKWKRWSYVLSLMLPPLGFVFGVYYFFKTESDAKSTAIICTVLTAVSIVFTALLFKAILSGSGASLQQIQQINPDEVYQLVE